MRITLLSGIAVLFLAGSVLAAPAPATTSLSEAEAKARIAAQGFGSVSDLSQDGMGLWHARAIKNGRRLNVVIDAEGRVQIDSGRSG